MVTTTEAVAIAIATFERSALAVTSIQFNLEDWTLTVRRKTSPGGDVLAGHYVVEVER